MTGPMSTGTCNLCGKDFAKNVIYRHLKKCLQEQAAASPGGKTQTTFWINVWGRYQPEYWLHLEVPVSAKLLNLDQFLRDTWLECCGHLSAFTIDEQRYEVSVDPEFDYWGEIPKNMNRRMGSVLQPEMAFGYEYDYGTTTELSGKVIAEQESTLKGKGVRGLARNLPPEVACGVCGKHAVYTCSFCNYEPSGWLCKDCAETHKCGDEGFLSIVNSPRVGQCAYGAEFFEATDV